MRSHLAGRIVWRLLLVACALSAPSACSPRPDPTPPESSPPVAQPVQPRAVPPAGSSSPGIRALPPGNDSPWTVDLARDEARGGHTLSRHVGRTDDQLRARLARESISAASTYVDRETAERVVSVALAENARRVQRWIDQRSPRANLAVRYRARDGLPTGRLLTRRADRSREVTGAVVVLRARGDEWFVLTSYPEEPR